MYACAGLANTATTAVVIIGLMHIELGTVPSNFAGYAVGLLLSFVLNSRYTFRANASGAMLVRFLAAAGIAYVANLIVVLATLYLTGAPRISQIAGMPVYTIVGYLVNKNWAMKG
ncbi:GtrA family protein [Paraburkholderia silviterrae]|uniref:GtrA family protein n=2 Tax=Paraburkholderia silviterrae TaxID=2528715 RepID=A0A4R5LZ21_9BURK|nr:GtrA family protein [Paraburkholderia silviterrae]